jgi:hypothetical protein
LVFSKCSKRVLSQKISNRNRRADTQDTFSLRILTTTRQESLGSVPLKAQIAAILSSRPHAVTEEAEIKAEKELFLHFSLSYFASQQSDSIFLLPLPPDITPITISTKMIVF